MQVFGRELPPGSIAWGVVGLLIVALVLVATGAFDSRERSMTHSEFMYSAVAEQLTSAEPGQPLRMRLEAQFPGPLQDTTVQRWRDPVDGTVCYIYLPVVVPHSAGPSGLVQYGPATIGSISCLPPTTER